MASIAQLPMETAATGASLWAVARQRLLGNPLMVICLAVLSIVFFNETATT